jgi:L-alanine-DL-glutamate epimerase-like enolase superfamily enzyme
VIVVEIETLRHPRHTESIWVRVATDEGVVGIGETMPKPETVESAIHERLAPLLLGRPALPEPFWARAFASLDYTGHAGAEMRALSALDIALWDALARRHEVPLVTLLGGAVRDEVSVYNTCVGYGEWPDHEAFLTRPEQLARELISEGYRAMKVWPFDAFSVATSGQRISRADLARGVGILARIRDAVGDEIEIAVEGHSCWNLPTAVQIASALEPYRPMWIEDPIPARSPSAWRSLRDSTAVPVCGSERVLTRFDAAGYFDAGAWDIVNQDVCWTGGLTEIRKIAALAETHELPLAPHNCHGPIGSAVTVIAGAVIPNVALIETVRSFERGINTRIADGAAVVENGVVRTSIEPGHGVTLRTGFLEECRRRVSRWDPDLRLPHGWSEGDPWVDGISETM